MSIDLLNRLKALHLYGMATAWHELQAEKPKQAHRPEVWLEGMLTAEQTDRQLKSLRHQLKSARFPIHRDLLGIDWNETPLAQALVEQMATAALEEIATFGYDQVGFMERDELVAAVAARIDRLVAAAVEKARREAYDVEVAVPQLNVARDDALKIASAVLAPDQPTFADEIASATAAHLQDAVRQAVRADPAAFVQSLVMENEELKSEVRQHSMILDVHSELIGVVKDLVSELERSAAAPAHLAAVKALVERAESSRLGEAQIPMGVSPFRIMATMEKLVSSHSEVIMQFGRNMPGTTVASCVRVLADATRLLEEIHGPANEVDASRDVECDDDLIRPQAT